MTLLALCALACGCSRLTVDEVPAKLLEVQDLIGKHESTSSNEAYLTSEKILMRVLQVDPSNSYAMNNLAWIRLANGGTKTKRGLEDALSLFKRARESAVGKMASPYACVIFLPPVDADVSAINGRHVDMFKFILQGIQVDGNKAKDVEITNIIDDNIFAAEFQLTHFK